MTGEIAVGVETFAVITNFHMNITHVANHAHEQIDGGENDLDLGLTNALLPRPCAIEQVFDAVGQLFDAGNSQRSRVGLEAMKRPKHLVERHLIIWRQFKGEDARLDRTEVVERLGEERPGQLGIAPKRCQLRVGRLRVRGAGEHQNFPKVPVSASAARSSVEAA